MKRLSAIFLAIVFLSGCASTVGDIKSAILGIGNKPKKEEPIYSWFDSDPNTATSPRGVSINAGFAKVKINPEGRQYIAGFFPTRTVYKIHDDLWAKCLVLEDTDHEYVAIVTTDLIGLLPDTVDAIRKKVSRFINPEKIFITSTHTHSGPDTMGLWGEGLFFPSLSDGKDKKYMWTLENKIAAIIEQAFKSRRGAKILFSKGNAPGLAVGTKDNVPDDATTALRIFFPNGGSVALINFSMHPDAVYSRYITADFVYFFRERMEAATGGQVMYINGAIGGVQPSKRGWAGAESLGYDLAAQVAKTFAKEIIPASNKITMARRVIKVPLENRLFKAAHVLGMIPDLRDNSGEVSVELNYINICGAKILTVPGELFPSIWLRLKSHLPGDVKMCWGLTNGELGYILTKKDFESGDHNYHAGVSVGPEMGDRIERALFEMIR